ncbi:MAG TPA: hypothetical protein VEQ11_04770 [Chloroflexota bacterium]|nr:hypothetical protein [Chloroflexota bacterium]
MGNASSGLGQVDEASKPASVLVVEDDPAVATVLRDVLAEDGYVVLAVASGVQGAPAPYRRMASRGTSISRGSSAP